MRERSANSDEHRIRERCDLDLAARDDQAEIFVAVRILGLERPTRATGPMLGEQTLGHPSTELTESDEHGRNGQGAH